jgi:ParB family chromosome partitioning protein
MDEPKLEELAASIRSSGVIQPIVVRPLDADRFEIVAGERRWRAAQRSGLLRVPVVVRDVADDKLLEVALIENLQRENLNPIEEARAYQRLISEYHLTEPTAQKRAAREVVARGLSVRETEDLVKKLAGQAEPAGPVSPPDPDVHTRAAQDRLRVALGTRVRIVRRGRKGRIEIAFTSEDELQRLFEQLTGP